MSDLVVIDTSALVAIQLHEPERDAFAHALDKHRTAISSSTLLEVRIVLGARGGHDEVGRILHAAETDIVPFDAAQADIASEAYRIYGRGSGHPARLNYGDSFSYALARHLDAPLLFKGEDFVHTDVRRLG